MLLFLSSCKKASKIRDAKKGVTGLLYEKKLVLESSLNRLQIVILSIYILLTRIMCMQSVTLLESQVIFLGFTSTR